MPFLHLGEIEQVLSLTPLWSRHRLAPASFQRADFFGDPQIPLEHAVRERIRQETGEALAGPVYLLANLRCFGFQMNPLCCYYCYAEDGETLRYLLAEVTNTPWNERHSYLLRADPKQRLLRREFSKNLHVSPFNPMDMRYHWRSNTPADRLAIHLEAHGTEGREMDATLALTREPLTRKAIHRTLWQFPLMTAQVAAGIYWQALKLFIKGVPVHVHPKTTPTTGART